MSKKAAKADCFFSAAYADEITIFNPFQIVRNWRYDKDLYSRNVSFYVSELLSLRPLIERGMVKFIDFYGYNYCERCFREGLSAVTGSSQDGDFYFRVFSNVIEKTDAVYRGRSKRGYHFDLKTESPFLGHKISSYSVFKRPVFLGVIKKGDHLKAEQLEALGVGDSTARFASNDIVQAGVASREFGIQNIFALRESANILRDYFGNDKVGDEINLSYPFITQGNINDILSFRDQEWHHLEDFRGFVDDCIRNGKNVENEIRAEAVKLEHLVQSANRSINKNLVKDAGILATNAITAVATSGISTLISAVVAALGGGHFAKSLLPNIVDRLSENEKVRDSKIYYSWKLGHEQGH